MVVGKETYANFERLPQKKERLRILEEEINIVGAESTEDVSPEVLKRYEALKKECERFDRKYLLWGKERRNLYAGMDVK